MQIQMKNTKDTIRILLVEDEESLQDVIQLNLELEGYEVAVAGDGRQALELFKKERYNLVLLDVMLPEVNGFDVCETIRLTNTEIPILMLTAKSSSSDKIKGLKIGADDYLTKPFNLEELLLRVEKLIGRSKQVEVAAFSDVCEFGNKNKVNFKTYEIAGINTSSKTIGNKEIKLLRLLIDRKGEVVSREEILEKVWGYDVYPSTRTIDNYILAFRKYFEADPKRPQHFHSIRGVGYKFTF